MKLLKCCWVIYCLPDVECLRIYQTILAGEWTTYSYLLS